MYHKSDIATLRAHYIDAVTADMDRAIRRHRLKMLVKAILRNQGKMR